MAGLKTEEAMLAISGAISTAPEATQPPMELTNGKFAALASPWINRGFVSEDGVTEENAVSRDEKRAWQNRTVLRRVVTESSSTFTFTLVQFNKENVELVRGTTLRADGTIVVNPAVEREFLSWCIDIEDGDRGIRKWLPRGKVDSIGEATYNSEDMMGWEITLLAEEVDFDGERGTYLERYSDISADDTEGGTLG